MLRKDADGISVKQRRKLLPAQHTHQALVHQAQELVLRRLPTTVDDGTG